MNTGDSRRCFDCGDHGEKRFVDRTSRFLAEPGPKGGAVFEDRVGQIHVWQEVAQHGGVMQGRTAAQVHSDASSVAQASCIHSGSSFLSKLDLVGGIRQAMFKNLSKETLVL